MGKKYMTDQEIRKIYNKMYPKKWEEMYFSEQQEAIEKDRKNKYTYILCKILDEHMETLEQRQREYLSRIIEHTKKYDKIIKDIIKAYKHELAEKDKELKLYKTVVHNMGISGIKEYGIEHVVDEIISADVKKIRHQVCEEIANQLDEYIDTHRWKWKTPDGKPKIVYIPNFTIREILSKIEKGE